MLTPILKRSLAVGIVASAVILGTGTAAADDYTALLVDPNVVVDTLAYTPGGPSMNPGGQPGAMQVYTHRDGRSITSTVWVLADPAAAAAAITEAQNTAGISNPNSQPVPVGTAGTYLSGVSADGSQALGLLTFTEGNTASALAFAGPIGDPAPVDFATELGQAQDALIKSRQGG